MQRKAVVVMTTLTRPSGEDDVRLALASEVVELASQKRHMVLVSEKHYIDNPSAVDRLEAAGAQVFPQIGSTPGQDRRDLFKFAQRILHNHSEFDGVLWTEEKPYMVTYIEEMIERMRERRAVALIPGRSTRSLATWPEFQRKSEETANMVYNHLFGQSEDGLYDPMHGPTYFSREVISTVTLFEPSMFGLKDVYIQHYVPPVLISRRHKIATLEIECEYPTAQKTEEEGTKFKEMVERRLGQQQQLIDAHLKLHKHFFTKK